MPETVECFVTTFDNPYNYFTQFDEWFAFDTSKGYYTCNKIARLVELKPSMTSIEEQNAIEDACKRFVDIDFMNLYRIIRRGDE